MDLEILAHLIADMAAFGPGTMLDTHYPALNSKDFEIGGPPVVLAAVKTAQLQVLQL